MPAALPQHRRLEDLRGRVPLRLGSTTVATVAGVVVGFVVTHRDAVEHLFVDATVRGTGVAARLLDHGEAVVGETFERAWLAVVPGNARARRFYERQGWTDAGPYDNPAFTRDGTTILVPTRRYEKRVGRRVSAAG